MKPADFNIGDHVYVKDADGHNELFIGSDGYVSYIQPNGHILVKIDNTCVMLKAEWLEKTDKPDTATSPMDKQIGGKHYKNFEIQPVAFIERNKLGFCVGNCIKYLCRYKDKNGREDLEKAKHYIELLIELEYPNTDNAI